MHPPDTACHSFVPSPAVSADSLYPCCVCALGHNIHSQWVTYSTIGLEPIHIDYLWIYVLTRILCNGLWIGRLSSEF